MQFKLKQTKGKNGEFKLELAIRHFNKNLRKKHGTREKLLGQGLDCLE